MALNAIRDVSRLDKCVSDHKQLASALAHPNCLPRTGHVLSSLLQQGRGVPHCLEMLQRGYRAKYTHHKRDFRLLALRIGGPRLLHGANHARCAPSRDQVLPKHKHQPIAYGNTITVEDILAVLPSKNSPFVHTPFLLTGWQLRGTLCHQWLRVHPHCYMGFAWSMGEFPKYRAKVICLPFANS